MCFENRQEIDVKEQNNKTTKKNKLNFFFFYLFTNKSESCYYRLQRLCETEWTAL